MIIPEWISKTEYQYIAFILLFIYTLCILYTIFKIIKDTNSPSKALGYLLVVIVVPIIGIILYYSVGTNYRMEKLYKIEYTRSKSFYKNIIRKMQIDSNHKIKNNPKILKDRIYTVKMLLNDSNSPLYTVKDLQLLINGENKFKEVLKALENAKKNIHIQYYIYSNDVIGNKIKNILIKKAKEGVTVRFIFDDFGSHELHKTMLKELEAGGVQVAAFYKIKLYALANRINYRNHRKIIIVDSEIGFIGGINVNDKYINSEENKNQIYWRDTHLKIEGEAVNGLQFTFINDWNFCAPEKKIILEDLQYFSIDDAPKDNYLSDNLVQIATSGPDSKRATIMLAYNGVIMSSLERLYLTTPYFIPNETIVNAIKHCALSGVDVRLIVPYKSDSKIVNAASSAYYEELLAVGVKIYRYTKGFIHAKTIVSDHNLSVIGSANLDVRSFDLNFEISALVYSKKLNQELAAAFMEDLKNCEELNYKQWANRNGIRKFACATAKLISPLL